jgi:hypothetical protein
MYENNYIVVIEFSRGEKTYRATSQFFDNIDEVVSYISDSMILRDVGAQLISIKVYTQYDDLPIDVRIPDDIDEDIDDVGPFDEFEEEDDDYDDY